VLSDEYPVRLLCKLLNCPPSSFYYTPKEVKEDDLALRDLIEEILLEFPYYGYRRVTVELHRRGVKVNHKRVLRIMRQNNLVKEVKRYMKTTLSNRSFGHYPNLIKGIEPEGPDHIWCADITYIRVKKEFLYLAVLMDLFTRAIRGWGLSRSLTEELTLAALKKVLAAHPAPKIHHSDHGMQYAAGRYIELLRARDVQISMAAVGKPTENAHLERFIRTLKEEEVYLNEYEDYEDAYQRIAYFIEDVYMTKRVHSALGYLTPSEFEAAYRAQYCLT